MQPAIKISNLSKKYSLGQSRNLWKYIHTRFYNRFGRKHIDRVTTSSTYRPVLWALKDINLSVPKGQILGVIGKNGSGKSTLFKILSRITWPTEGQVSINGRISSLLEVGTGFHPELTGRENIYLNGAILGMKHKEIKKKFDEIIDFSGIEKFLETPVKRYSSGMRVRLGFAVAAHLDPDILLVDEVLSVGDMEFRNKCMGRMDSIAKDGRTILFVSHNMAQMQELCHQCVLLEEGQITKQGTPAEVISTYTGFQATNSNSPVIEFETPASSQSQSTLSIEKVSLLDSQNTPSTSFDVHAPLQIETVLNDPEHHSFILRFYIHDSKGNRVYHMRSRTISEQIYKNKTKIRVLTRIPQLVVVNGTYHVTLSLSDGLDHLVCEYHDVLCFNVIDRSGILNNWPGIVHENGQWQYSNL